jgi:hypothetical protein
MTKDLIIQNIGLLKVIQRFYSIKTKQRVLRNYFTLLFDSNAPLRRVLNELEKQFKNISIACKSMIHT